MNNSNDHHASGAASPEIAAQEDKVRRRQSTLGGRRSCRSVGGRMSLAAPPTLGLRDQVMQIEESHSWDTKLNSLLNIALREAVRRLEARLPGDEYVPELRAAILTQAGTVAKQLSECVCDLTPVVTATEHTSPITSIEEAYKGKTRAMEQEYAQWKAIRRHREAECHSAEMEFQEAKSGVTTMDEGQEVFLSRDRRRLLDTWPDCSHYVEEAQQATEKAHLVLEEVKHTTQVVNGFLTASRLQADSSYAALESVSNAHIKTEPLAFLMNHLLQLHLGEEAAAQPITE